MNVPLIRVDAMTSEQKQVYDIFPINLTTGLLLTNSTEEFLALGLSFRTGAIAPSIRELVILRVGARTETHYEVFHHRTEAVKVGVSSEDIDTTINCETSYTDPKISVLIAFVDQLIATHNGTTASTDEMEKYFSAQEIAEITLLVGYYLMTALFITTLGIHIEEQPVDSSHILATATDHFQNLTNPSTEEQ